jgi:multisubunit Na+/H+ antiporter MnhF subunit
MNLWLLAGAGLVLGIVPCCLVLRRGQMGDGLLAQQLSAQIATFVLLLIGVGTGQAFVLDLALSVVLLSTVGTLLFARFLERWL